MPTTAETNRRKGSEVIRRPDANNPIHAIPGAKPEANYFDGVEVGQRFVSSGRTITETDIVNFAGVTGDYDPLHVDHEYCRHTPYGQPIAHGMFGMSLVAGLGSHAPCMNTAAFVQVVEWVFSHPIFVGDTLHVDTEVMRKEPSGSRRGLITWKRRLINQHGEIVQEGTTKTLVLVNPDAVPHERGKSVEVR